MTTNLLTNSVGMEWVELFLGFADQYFLWLVHKEDQLESLIGKIDCVLTIWHLVEKLIVC